MSGWEGSACKNKKKEKKSRLKMMALMSDALCTLHLCSIYLKFKQNAVQCSIYNCRIPRKFETSYILQFAYSKLIWAELEGKIHVRIKFSIAEMGANYPISFNNWSQNPLFSRILIDNQKCNLMYHGQYI